MLLPTMPARTRAILSRIENNGQQAIAGNAGADRGSLRYAGVVNLRTGRGARRNSRNSSSGFGDSEADTQAVDLVHLRQNFRALTPANRRIAVELLKALERTQA
jgi:hypothetical protein